MTKDDIIRMRHEAHAYANCEWDIATPVHHWCKLRDEHFAKLVATAEREDCAEICKPQERWDDPLTAYEIAQAIRARGQS